MEDILHILNGDATLRGFEETGLDGDVMVWREVLSEGPLEENIASAGFWKKRGEWISKGFEDNPNDYEEKVINQLSKLSEPYTEFNLWFEFDLHCQVNMLGVVMMLSKRTDLSPPAIYLICPEEVPGVEDFRGMGELNGEQLDDLYDNIRVQLGEPDFFVAAEVWKIYTRNQPGELKKYLEENNYWGNLHCLKNALHAHLRRIQINKDGLNYIEQLLVDIYRSGITNRADIYKAFWLQEKIYGMGDMEIDIYLNRLQQKQLIELT
jgi:hypothetical protein